MAHLATKGLTLGSHLASKLRSGTSLAARVAGVAGEAGAAGAAAGTEAAAAQDASLCSAVIQPLVARVGRWVVDASVALLE